MKIVTVVVAGALGLTVMAQGVGAQEIKRDREDIRQDRREIRKDTKEIQQDRRELRRDLRQKNEGK